MSKSLVLIGMKSCGKTTIGKILARRLELTFTDMDAEIERLHAQQKGERLRFREIFARYGKDYFRDLETSALRNLDESKLDHPCVLATGGGLPLAEANRPLLKKLGTIVFLDATPEVLLARILPRGIPAFFPYPDDPARSLTELLAVRRPIYQSLAQISVVCQSEPPESVADRIIVQLERTSL
jgi:shikimate kinase